MNFPFVVLPRSVYEDGRRDLERAQARIVELTETIIHMKASGAMVARQVAGAEPDVTAKKEPSRIDLAIDQNKHCTDTPRGRELRRRLSEWADQQIKDGVPVEDVEESILTWDQIRLVDRDDDEDEDALEVSA